MDTCLWVVGCKKPNPRINLMGSRVWNPPYEAGFMVKLQVIESGFRTNLTNLYNWFMYGL